MEKGKKVEKVLNILEALHTELEIFCNDICNATNCHDCNIHEVMDKLAEVIDLLNKRC